MSHERSTRARRLKKLAAQVRASNNQVLQYNRDRDELVPWDWYVCIANSTWPCQRTTC
jgi:hypothetical protein